MSRVDKVDWTMDTHLQKAYEELAWLITEGKATLEEVINRLKWGYGEEIADWFCEWWDEAEYE